MSSQGETAKCHAAEFAKLVNYNVDKFRPRLQIESECMQYIDLHRDFYDTTVEYSNMAIWYACAVIYAGYFGQDNVVLQLIANGADINAADSYGDSLLIVYCQQYKYDMILKLINHGADVNTVSKYKRTALLILCNSPPHEQQLVVVTALINRGADVNKCDTYTPLCYALQRGNIELAIKLINAGARFVEYLDINYVVKYPQVVNEFRHKYNESILAAMNDECPTNAFAASFKKIYVPQLVDIITAFIL
ncbi:MAG: hypothetical protein Faunusvirus20_3 [Faunusvirus sp.]|jgi:hypothetical protein|uniref:Uncharacterized protein n=1 Tax=Faunusvirus sp. TaxID=2487766 RepID=A0A3G4ZXE3_9VIRU|nr:MAG: hypothetical protein Faunusvirus20_3 [Faunusvirus sp.]